MESGATAMRGGAAVATAGWRTFRAGSYRWRVRAEFDSPSLRERLADPAGLFRPPARHLKDPVAFPAAETASVEMPECPPFAVVVKRYRVATVLERVKSCLRGSRAERALLGCARLEEAGVATFRVVGAGSRLLAPWDCFLITKYVSCAVSLADFYGTSVAPALSRRLVGETARLVAALHNEGFRHRDLHAGNFLATGTEPVGVVLVDADGLRRAPRVSVRAASRDLARLWRYAPATPREQARFVVMYARMRKPALDVRTLWRLLTRRVSRKYASAAASRVSREVRGRRG